MKNRILLENHFQQESLEAAIDEFVGHYHHRRYDESLKNLTPADVYYGRGQTILLERESDWMGANLQKEDIRKTALAARQIRCLN